MDIGTPERYLQATWDVLEGTVRTAVEATSPGVFVADSAEVAADARIGPRAVVSRRLPDRPRGRDPRIGPARRMQRRRRGAGSVGSILAPGAEVGPELAVDGAVAGRREKVRR